jgi:4-aminobutyrate aminotransferase-like enzyme
MSAKSLQGAEGSAPATPQAAKKSAKIVVPPPGPKSRALLDAERSYLAPGTQQVWQLAGIAASHGEGAVLEDVDGNRYVDLMAGIGVASLGYGHKRQAKAIGEQAEKLIVGSYTTAPRVSLLKKIADVTPAGAGLVRTQLYSSGAEAVESALRLARAHTGKFEVVSFWGGFHGKTQGVLGLMGSDFKHGLGPQAPGLHTVPYADCYRCPFKMSYPSCGVACVDFMREALKKQTAGSVAAIIAEPIQGTNGNVVPPDEFLPAVKEVAKEIGALFISDEMITGFGRTGKAFGCEQSGVVPDIMTIGKGLGSGFPITGVVSTDAITASPPWSKPSFSSSSFGGNPLAAAAADAAVGAMIDEDLIGNSQRVGKVLLEALLPFVDKFPFVGEVRGRGLMIGLELVSDKATKAPLPRKVCEQIFLRALHRGVITMAYTNRVRINPPLVITEDQALEAVAVLDEVFTELSEQGAWR